MPERLANLIYWASSGVSRMTEMSEEEARRRKKPRKEAMRLCRKLTRLNKKGRPLNKSQKVSMTHGKTEEPKREATNDSKGRVFWKHELDAKRAEEEAKATKLQSKAQTKAKKGRHKRAAKERARVDAEMAMHKATPSMRGSLLIKLGNNEAKPINKDALKEFYHSHTRSKKKHKNRRGKRHK